VTIATTLPHVAVLLARLLLCVTLANLETTMTKFHSDLASALVVERLRIMDLDEELTSVRLQNARLIDKLAELQRENRDLRDALAVSRRTA
jgi:hypothetical protein